MSTHLIDAYRQYLIERIQPNTLNPDIKLGLQQKEKMISDITEDYLRSIIPNYDAMELYLSQSKNYDNFRKFICGESNVADLQIPEMATVKYRFLEGDRLIDVQPEYTTNFTEYFDMRISITGEDFSSYNSRLVWAKSSDPNLLNPTTTYTLLENEKIITVSRIRFNGVYGFYDLSIQTSSSIRPQYITYKNISFKV